MRPPGNERESLRERVERLRVSMAQHPIGRLLLRAFALVLFVGLFFATIACVCLFFSPIYLYNEYWPLVPTWRYDMVEVLAVGMLFASFLSSQLLLGLTPLKGALGLLRIFLAVVLLWGLWMGPYLLAITNGALDTSPPKTHRLEVLARRAWKTDFFWKQLSVRDYREDREIRFSLKPAHYAGCDVGDEIEITVYPGRYGFPWWQSLSECQPSTEGG